MLSVSFKNSIKLKTHIFRASPCEKNKKAVIKIYFIPVCHLGLSPAVQRDTRMNPDGVYCTGYKKPCGGHALTKKDKPQKINKEVTQKIENGHISARA